MYILTNIIMLNKVNDSAPTFAYVIRGTEISVVRNIFDFKYEVLDVNTLEIFVFSANELIRSHKEMFCCNFNKIDRVFLCVLSYTDYQIMSMLKYDIAKLTYYNRSSKLIGLHCFDDTYGELNNLCFKPSFTDNSTVVPKTISGLLIYLMREGTFDDYVSFTNSRMIIRNLLTNSESNIIIYKVSDVARFKIILGKAALVW